MKIFTKSYYLLKYALNNDDSEPKRLNHSSYII